MRHCILAATAVAFALAPVAAEAACIVSGQITRVSVNPGAVVTTFYVTGSNPGSTSFLFGTTDGKIVIAAMTAQASHMAVRITGNAAACPAPVGGASNGGIVISLTTAP